MTAQLELSRDNQANQGNISCCATATENKVLTSLMPELTGGRLQDTIPIESPQFEQTSPLELLFTRPLQRNTSRELERSKLTSTIYAQKQTLSDSTKIGTSTERKGL